jgi:hypothetical protein
MALLLGTLGVVAIPRAFAVMATLEAIALGVVVYVKMRNRLAVVPAIT